MLLPGNRLLLGLALATLVLGSCGYGLGTDAPSVLTSVDGDRLPTLKIKGVEHPTLYPWLSYIVRSEVRDELGARKIARLVDSGRADYEMTLKISSFTFRSSITNADDMALLYSASMVMSATVYRGDSNQVAWQSPGIGYSQQYEAVQERAAASELVKELAKRLVLAMRQSF